MPVSEFEKQIYNNFLIASRSCRNKPIRPRKNFDNIDVTTALSLKKLSLFFKANTKVNILNFFKAPYYCYSKDDFFDLQFFLSRKALKCYTLFCREREMQDPDSAESLHEATNCCKFIYNFCKERQITLQKYKTINEGTTPVVLQHLKDHKINFYMVHGLDISKILNSIEPELLNFFIDDFRAVCSATRLNFVQSKKLKTIIKKALQLIEDKLLIFN